MYKLLQTIVPVSPETTAPILSFLFPFTCFFYHRQIMRRKRELTLIIQQGNFSICGGGEQRDSGSQQHVNLDCNIPLVGTTLRSCLHLDILCHTHNVNLKPCNHLILHLIKVWCFEWLMWPHCPFHSF